MAPFLLLLLLSVSTAVSSQNRPIYPLWPESVPGESKEKKSPVISPDKSGHVTRMSEVTDPMLEVFKPEGKQVDKCGIIVCPGGGYELLAIDLEGYEIASWLNQSGITAFVLQYRVPQKKTGALQDLQRAIRIVRSKHPELTRIGVIGFSAGGSLAARASTLYPQQRYEPIDNADSLSCRPDFSLLIYPAYLDEGKDRSLTPELKIDANTPPMFVFGTGDDFFGNSTLTIARALNDARVPVELHFLPQGGHGYGLRKGNIAAETWTVLALKWLQKIAPPPVSNARKK